MAYRACDVGACINVSGDHLGLGGVETLEQLAEVKRIVVEVATDTAVLNADDELCLKMADYTTAKNLCYVTMNPRHPLVREHIRAGARAVVLEDGLNGQQIVLYDNGRHIPLLWTHLIPATMEGRALHNVQNAMFATAVTYSLGKKLDDIRHGLRTGREAFVVYGAVYAALGFKSRLVTIDYCGGGVPTALPAATRSVPSARLSTTPSAPSAKPPSRRIAPISRTSRSSSV